MSQPIDEGELRRRLSPEQYAVLREGATERAFTGQYVDEKADGTYHCAACGHVLFDAQTKFDSRSGWPSFTEPADRAFVELIRDESHGMVRTEVRCSNCGSHLGHVFDDGPIDAGGERWCINSLALDLEKREGA